MPKIEKANINALTLAKQLISSVELTCETNISREDLEEMVKASTDPEEELK